MAAVALLFVLAHWDAGAQAEPLRSLYFLLGDWQAIDTAPGESGAFTFKLAVQDHIIVRTNEANYAVTDGRTPSRHEDLLVIYSDDGSIKADYYDSEGHVIRYRVEARGPGAVVFVSEASPQEPTYRLSYASGTDGVLTGLFEIAPPGTPTAFKPYKSWKARKR
jgi:hypothetical protein